MLFGDVKGPYIATDNVGDSKTGTSEAMTILGLVALGDASIDAAMKDGGITKVQRADYHTFNILGVYAKLTMTVKGE